MDMAHKLPDTYDFVTVNSLDIDIANPGDALPLSSMLLL